MSTFVETLPFGVRFTVPGAPRTKKNHGRIWNRGNRRIIRPSEAWLEWRDMVKRYTATKPEFRLRIDKPVNCCAHFYRDREAGDSHGYYNGIADVLQEIEVVVDDKWLVSWDGSRLFKDNMRPRTEVILTWA